MRALIDTTGTNPGEAYYTRLDQALRSPDWRIQMEEACTQILETNPVLAGRLGISRFPDIAESTLGLVFPVEKVQHAVRALAKLLIDLAAECVELKFRVSDECLPLEQRIPESATLDSIRIWSKCVQDILLEGRMTYAYYPRF
ncbi:MAG: hypothetical protein WC924_05540 [Candidatus Gracilibacteria bacterium]